MDLETRRAVFSRKLVCRYIACSAMTYSARAERHVENQVPPHPPSSGADKGKKKLYEGAAGHSTQFRNHWKMLDNPLEESARKDMLPKYSFLLMIAFEGTVKLGNWDALKGIIHVLATHSS